MTNNYKAARMNMSPHANHMRNAAYANRPMTSQSGGNNQNTYSMNVNAAVEGGTPGGFFPSGYVYSSQNAANPTGYFYGNMPQTENRGTPSRPAGAFDNGVINRGAGSGQSAGRRAMQQMGQSRGMNASGNFNGSQASPLQNAQMSGGGNAYSSAPGMPNMQNGAAGIPNMQSHMAAPQSAVRQGTQMAGGKNGFAAAGPQNRSAGMPSMQNRAAPAPSGGLFGGIGGMVKGILGEDPLGSIGKVVNIMKMLG